MKRVLITGMSGTGKSAIIQGLQQLGYKAIDMDYEGWSELRDDGEWIWNEEKIKNLFKTDTHDILFIAGCSENQVKFYQQFDIIILLSTPINILIQRIKERTNNPFGKRDTEFQKILTDLREIEPKLRKGATNEINTSNPLQDTIQEIIRLLK